MSDERQVRPVTWVVGGGGLLGRSLRAELQARGDLVIDPAPVPWSSPGHARAALRQAVGELAATARRSGAGWRVAWCAGAGVTGTASSSLDAEVAALTTVLAGLADHADVPGSLFLASSAGGLYAGSPEPPFTEEHPAVPLAPYGEAKVRQEQLVGRFAAHTGVPTLVGRIANLYGPGQNLDKPQGLVSHLCRSYLTGQPVSIYVPLDTVRDYLFVRDAAAMVADALDALDRSPAGTRTMKILASQQGTTVGALLGECRRVLKRTPRVVLGSSSTARHQALDLRLRSTVWRALDERSLTPLPVGIAATYAGLLRSRQTRQAS